MSFINMFSRSVGCLFLCCAKAFSFDRVPLVYFCFCCLCFSRPIQTIVAKTAVEELAPVFSFQEFYGFRPYVRVSNPLWVNFCVWPEIAVHFYSFARGCPGVSTEKFKTWDTKYTYLAVLFLLCRCFLSCISWNAPRPLLWSSLLCTWGHIKGWEVGGSGFLLFKDHFDVYTRWYPCSL